MAKSKKKEVADIPLASTQLPKELDDQLAAYCGEVKKKRAVLWKAVGWFLSLDDVAKTAIIGDIDHGMEKIYAEVLRDLAGKLESRGDGSSGDDETVTVVRGSGPAGSER